MLKTKKPFISIGKYFIRGLSKKEKILQQLKESSKSEKQNVKIDDQNILNDSLHIFPIKNQPIFPQNSYVTRINPFLFQKLNDDNVKFVSAYLIKDNIDFQTIQPQQIVKDKQIEFENNQIEKNELENEQQNKENELENELENVQQNIENKENLDKSIIKIQPDRWADTFHQNIFYDDNISNLPYNDHQEDPGILKIDSIDQVHEIGTLCKLSLTKLKNGDTFDLVAMLKGIQKIKIQEIINEDEIIQKVQSQSIPNDKEMIDAQYQAKLANLLGIYAKLKNKVPVNVPELIFKPSDIRTLDILSGYLCLTSFFEKRQIYQLFQLLSTHERVNLCYDYYSQYEQQLIQHYENLDSQTKVPMNINKSKQEMDEIYQFLKKQMQIPQSNNLVEQLKIKSEKKKFPEEVQKIIDQQFSQIQDMPESHPEFNRIKTFIELILELPFNQQTEVIIKHLQDKFDLEYAKEILDKEHYGLKDVKDRILEFIAVSKLLGRLQGRTILLVGPPGVGKTSIAKSVANCLGRKFAKITLGGDNDVSIIKGHKKTYLGAQSGKIIQALKNLQTENPVILLDEIDKIQQGWRGNIQDALLEVLDPVQNKGFLDNYLDFKYDLSNVLFICTSNLLDTINPALLDRLEIIKLSGYITDEKIKISENYLIPRALEETGINTYLQSQEQKQQIVFQNETLIKLINEYARESGVRNMNRQLMKICEKISYNIVTEQQNNFEIQPQHLKDYIGLPIYSQKKMYDGIPPPGIMIGLAYNAYGGNVLYIETIKYNFDQQSKNTLEKKDRKGSIKLTGSLGDVMQESIQIAYTFAKYFSHNLLNNSFLEQNDIHIHFPQGSSKKDGTSAGMAITASLVSLAIGKGMKKEIAMTGEISLKGKVLKIGGVKEKVLAAKRENVLNLILPLENKQDVDDLSDDIKDGIQFNFVDNFYEMMPLLFSDIKYKDNNKENIDCV